MFMFMFISVKILFLDSKSSKVLGSASTIPRPSSASRSFGRLRPVGIVGHVAVGHVAENLKRVLPHIVKEVGVDGELLEDGG
jgi:hypothetical protein